MKTFVYKKRGNALVAIIQNVTTVIDGKDEITFISDDGSHYCFDKHKLKTTTYQN